MSSDSPSQPVEFDFNFDFEHTPQQRLSLDEPRLANQGQHPTEQEVVHRPIIKRRSLPSGFSLASIQYDSDDQRVADTQSSSPTMPKHGDLIPGKVTRDGDGRIIAMQASYRHFDPPDHSSPDQNRNSLPRSPALRSLAGYQIAPSTRKPLQPSLSTHNSPRLAQGSIRRKKQNVEITERVTNETADAHIAEPRSATPLSDRVNELQIENKKLKKDLSRERQATTQSRSAADIKEIERLEELLQQERKGYELARGIHTCQVQKNEGKLLKAEDEIAHLNKLLDQVSQAMGLKDDALNTQKAVSRGLEGIIAARDGQIRARDQMMRTKDQMLMGLRVGKRIAEEDAQRYADALIRALNHSKETKRLLIESQADVDRLQAQVTRLQNPPVWKRRESHRWSTMQTLVDDEDDTNNSASEEVDSCIICLDHMPRNGEIGLEIASDNHEGQKRAILPCGHAFHAGCVRHWHSKSFSCPYCRQGFEWQLAKRDGAVQSAAVAGAGADDDDAALPDSPLDSESDEGPDDDIVPNGLDLDRQAIRDEIMNAEVGVYASVLLPPAGGFRPQRPAPRVTNGVGFTSRLRRQVNGWFRRVTRRV